MSYFKPYIDEEGIHVPTYQDTLDFLIDGYKRIFGDDVYVGVDSPDYQLMALYAKVSDNYADAMIENYNSKNPNWSSGNALDLNVALNGIRRKNATYSKATLTVTGEPNTVLNRGSLARDQLGRSWETQSNVTFDSDGNATVVSQCITEGSIAAAAGTINECETPVANWYTVTNAQPAVRGDDLETDAELRQRRINSVATPARSVLEGIIDSVRNVKGVKKVTIYDLVDAQIKDKNSETIENQHAIYAVVDGGQNSDIAETIFINKTPGIGTYGTVSVTHTDEYGKTNVIKFSRPEQVAVSITLSLTRLSLWDEQMISKIKNACISCVDSVAIGSDLIVPTLYSQIYQEFTGETVAFVINSLKANLRLDVVKGYANSMFTCKASDITLTFN